MTEQRLTEQLQLVFIAAEDAQVVSPSAKVPNRSWRSASPNARQSRTR